MHHLAKMRAPTAALPLSFFFNDPATTEIYTLSLHDALRSYAEAGQHRAEVARHMIRHLDAYLSATQLGITLASLDRKSTRLNSSHSQISYAVFCLKKKICTTTCSPPRTYLSLYHAPSGHRS